MVTLSITTSHTQPLINLVAGLNPFSDHGQIQLTSQVKNGFGDSTIPLGTGYILNEILSQLHNINRQLLFNSQSFST